MVLVLFFPESPRWLIAHDRREEALAIFAKYHGDGDEQSPIVQLQYHEIVEQLNLTRNENPWWDFRELANTRGNRYRLYMVIGMAFIGQWSGNNVVNYFMVWCSLFVFHSLTVNSARNDDPSRHHQHKQAAPNQRHQPNLLHARRRLRRHPPRQTWPTSNDAHRP